MGRFSGFGLGNQTATRLGLLYHCARLAAVLTSPAMEVYVRSGRQLRRSKRLTLSIRVHVFGQDLFRESFSEFTHVLCVSAHGGALALAAKVEKGHRILVANKSTGEERECRIVHVGSPKDGKWTVGFEFVEPVGNFWKINFPACIPRQAAYARR